MNSAEEVLKQLEFLAQMIPIPLYWMDLNGVLLGANEVDVKAVGADSVEPYLGKTPYEYYQYDIADNIMQHTKKVIETGKALTHEDPIIDLTTGEKKYFTAIRAPLRDYDGNIIGVIGTGIDITAQKEAEVLKLKNKELELEEHKKMRIVADQMAHDLGSPLMALSVLENCCAELPEAKRNMLRESISSIREIAGSLLSRYKLAEEEAVTDKVDTKELLVYAVLQQVIIDKQYEYQHLPVKFDCEYTKNSIFSFVKSDLISFKRMLSNLINNAVEAIDGSGKVLLKLDSDNKEVRVSIIDNGQGMSDSSVNKLMSNISFSVGKENGHGIGFSQVHETLARSRGRLAVDSKKDIGTTIILTFPQVIAPEWIAKEILVKSNDTILVLDDDNSIHSAWDIRFNEVLKVNPNIEVKHFTEAMDVINFVGSIDGKENIVLLSDYELLRQKFNGLDVIERTQIKRSILVTSHYTDIDIRRQAYKMNTKILPKLLASEIQINILK